jgi:CBS domain-containing protein
VRARDLATTYPSLTPDAPAEEAARQLAEEAVQDVVVQDEQGGLRGCVSDTTLLGFLLPRYLAENRTLVGMLGGVDGDDTLLTAAATLARTGASPVVVRDEDSRLLLGGITISRLIRRLQGAP